MLSSNAQALLDALLRDLPGEHHHLTLHTRYAMTTAIDRRGKEIEVERPEVVERLCATVLVGASAAVVLRILTDQVSHTLPDGTDLPLSLLLGWWLDGRTLHPLDEAAMFDAHCTDAASGEPIPPEPGVKYTNAPEVDLSSLNGL